MPTEEYFRAKSTGIADMSKPGAAEGLIERRRAQAQEAELRQRHQASAGQAGAAGRKFGEDLVGLLRWSFPVWSLLVVWAGGCAALLELGVLAGLAADVGTLPAWFMAGSGVLLAVPVIWLRHYIRKAVKLVLLAAVVLVAGAFVAGMVAGIWERMAA